MFLVSETVIVRLSQRNYDCYCDYFILIIFNYVRFRLRLGCLGSFMSLYGPTFHVTPVDLCIIFKCNLYISCIMSCGIISILSKEEIQILRNFTTERMTYSFIYCSVVM